MALIILVTGGSRSGKSEFARNLAEALPGPRVFVATCPVVDDEMKERIEKHRRERLRSNWQTIEEPMEVSKVLSTSHDSTVFLVDCLTLWMNNLIFRAQEEGAAFSEEDAIEECRELLDASWKANGTVIFVTNEVGSGIVPENATARLFRDVVGRCNQTVAQAADEVYLVASGLPITLKKGND